MIGRVTQAGPVTRQPAGPVAGRLRLLRVGVLGLSAYGLAVGAHVGAGGAAPGWPVSVMLATLLGVLGVGFTARRRRLWSLLGALVVAQSVLHGLFSLLDTPAAGCSMVATGHHATTAVCGPAGGAAMAVPSLPMLLAHLAATAATAWLLARGEAWLWRVVRAAFTPRVAVPTSDEPRVRTLVGREIRPQARFVRPDAARAPPPATALTN
jgi:hypothetical protein